MKNYIKINKRQARKLHAIGSPYTMCASNLRPELFGVRVSDNPENFDHLINDYSYYNCINSETGRRVVFYIDG